MFHLFSAANRLLAFAFFALCQSISFAQNQATVLPFKLVGNTIFVQAEVNGKSHRFILDTGSKEMILNSAYFEGNPMPWLNSSVADVNGKMKQSNFFQVRRLSLKGVLLKNILARVIDLAPIEKAKGGEVAGILGFDVFKKMKLTLDFDNQQVSIVEAAKKARGNPENCRKNIHAFSMNGHLPCLKIELEGKELHMGLDSGSEVNILHNGIAHENFKAERVLKIRSFSGHSKTSPIGKIAGMSLRQADLGEMEVALVDLQFFKDCLPGRLDGILGTPFLRQYMVTIDYRNKEVSLQKTRKPMPLAKNLGVNDFSKLAVPNMQILGYQRIGHVY